MRSVRFAVAPGEPVAGAPDGVDLRVLTGILVELSGAEVRCVATDRYRLAVGVGAGLDGQVDLPAGPVSAVVPVGWADRVVEACDRADPDARGGGRGGARARGSGRRRRAARDPGRPGVVPRLPEHRRLGTGPRPGRRRGPAGRAARGAAIGRPRRVRRRVQLAPSDDAGVADVFVDPEFLHEALAMAGPRPTLVLDGPLRPLAIRGDGAGFSVLMPVAPEGSRR